MQLQVISVQEKRVFEGCRSTCVNETSIHYLATGLLSHVPVIRDLKLILFLLLIL